MTLPINEFEAALDKFDAAMKPISQVAYFEYEIDGVLSDGEFTSRAAAMARAQQWFEEYHQEMNEGEYSSKEDTAYIVALDEDKNELYRDSFELSWEKSSNYDEHNTHWGL